jgi:hypothetical protein
VHVAKNQISPKSMKLFLSVAVVSFHDHVVCCFFNISLVLIVKSFFFKIQENMFRPDFVCSSEAAAFSSEFEANFKAGKFSEVYGGPEENGNN